MMAKNIRHDAFVGMIPADYKDNHDDCGRDLNEL